MCKDLGLGLAVSVWTDSSACRGKFSKTGLGKLRHMNVQLLLLQGILTRRQIEIKKIHGKVTSANLMTKHLGRNVEDKFLGMLLFREVAASTGSHRKHASEGEFEDRDLKLAPGGA